MHPALSRIVNHFDVNHDECPLVIRNTLQVIKNSMFPVHPPLRSEVADPYCCYKMTYAHRNASIRSITANTEHSFFTIAMRFAQNLHVLITFAEANPPGPMQ